MELLVHHYLVTIDKVFPLLDPVRIKEELHDFWKDQNSVSDPWLAQLYLMVALGCFAHPTSSFEGIDMDSTTIQNRCLDAAEACYGTTRSFMKRANYTDMRVLCMIAIAKMVDLIAESDVAWIFVGLIARIALGMQLHRDPGGFSNMPPRDAEARKRIWTTVQMLDLLTSIDVGHQMYGLPENSDTPAPANNIITSDDGTVDTSDPNNDTVYQLRLMVVYPIVCSIVNKVNGPYSQMPYTQVLKYDEMLRQALKQTQSSSGLIPHSRVDPSQPDWVYLQKTTVNNLLRRVLLALHQSHARDAKESSVYQKSHWTVLECSLAILRHQRELFENPQLAWATEVFRSDFRTAMIHVTLGIRNNHFADKPDPRCTLSAKDLAWEALRGGFDMMMKSIYRSADNFKGYIGTAVGIGVLEALEKGMSVPEAIRHSAEKAFEQAEEQIRIHRPQIDPSLSGLTLEPDLDGVDSAFLGSAGLSPFLWDNNLDPALFDGSLGTDLFVSGYVNRLTID